MPLGDSFFQPAHVSLVNLSTNELLEVQYNPTELEELIGAVYAKQTVPGLSHQVQQFINTENMRFTLELFFQATNSGEAGAERLAVARKFFIAVCHPRGTGGVGSLGRGAPRVLFVWPEMISLTCVVHSVRMRHTKFKPTGASTVYTANVELEEIRDVFVSSEDITRAGTQRAPSPPFREL